MMNPIVRHCQTKWRNCCKFGMLLVGQPAKHMVPNRCDRHLLSAMDTSPLLRIMKLLMDPFQSWKGSSLFTSLFPIDFPKPSLGIFYGKYIFGSQKHIFSQQKIQYSDSLRHMLLQPWHCNHLFDHPNPTNRPWPSETLRLLVFLCCFLL